MTDDAYCLRRYADSRDEAAFAEFVRRNVALVYSAACRQAPGNRELAEDIVQTVFVSAAGRRPHSATIQSSRPGCIRPPATPPSMRPARISAGRRGRS